MISIEAWSVSKVGDDSKNEDRLLFDHDFVALADGATDKSGVIYPSKNSGGRELAAIATEGAKLSSENGYDLADEVTDAVRIFYGENNPDALTDSSKRASTTLVVARFLLDRIVVTQIGDTNVRVTLRSGERIELSNDKLIDEENAALRSARIKKQLEDYETEHGRLATGETLLRIIGSGRDVIKERLEGQHLLQNSDTDEQYGYGTIDGSNIPRTFQNGSPTEYVKQYEFDRADVASVELVSDGFYGQYPKRATIDEYRILHEAVHKTDPFKYTTYLSTKPNDDATVVIVSQ
jgi:serine/threonine protein phosphatase PrpC